MGFRVSGLGLGFRAWGLGVTLDCFQQQQPLHGIPVFVDVFWEAIRTIKPSRDVLGSAEMFTRLPQPYRANDVSTYGTRLWRAYCALWALGNRP